MISFGRGIGDRVIVDYYYRLLPTAKGKVRLAQEQLNKGAGPYERVVGEYLNAAIRRRLWTNEACPRTRAATHTRSTIEL